MEKKLTIKLAAKSDVEKKIVELDRTFVALQADYAKKREMLVVELCKLDGAIETLKDLINGQGKEDNKQNENDNG